MYKSFGYDVVDVTPIDRVLGMARYDDDTLDEEINEKIETLKESEKMEVFT